MTDGGSRSDAELLVATPADPDAFAVFYRRHVQMVLAVIARRAQPALVGDLVARCSRPRSFIGDAMTRRAAPPPRG
jgi:hypothetical protein